MSDNDNYKNYIDHESCKNTEKYPIIFVLLYAFYFGANGILNPYLPVYLEDIGMNQTVKGILLALGPFVAMFSQPFWGIIGDRAKTKNIILKILFFSSAAIFILFPLNKEIWYTFLIYIIFMFFYSSINPTIDTITLEYLERRKWKFGPIRMGGTIGYALIALLSGFIIERNINYMFFMYSTILFISLFFIRNIPPVKGYQFGKEKISPSKLIKNKKLIALLGFGFAVQMTLGYYYSFYSIYFKQSGGDNSLLGWSMFLAGISEIPFLLFADKITKKMGIINTLIVSSLITSLRWFFVYISNSPKQLLLTSCLHGFTFIVFTYCLAVFINENVPRELKASGQALNGLINMGAARIVGNILGGVLSDVFGIKQMFFYISIIAIIATGLFGFILKKLESLENRT